MSIQPEIREERDTALSLSLSNWTRHSITSRRRFLEMGGEILFQYHLSGQLSQEKWYMGEALHSDDGPAVLDWDENGSPVHAAWLRDGEFHREDGPSVLRWYPSESPDVQSILYTERWYNYGLVHREDGPAILEYLKNGLLRSQKWRVRGQPHRLNDLPSDVVCDINGNLYEQFWHVDGKQHRVGRPAYIQWDESRVLVQESWYMNGEEHREDGPSSSNRYDSTWFYRWRLNGVVVSQEQHDSYRNARENGFSHEIAMAWIYQPDTDDQQEESR